ncbi:MAG: ATP-binding cassette domain-containing protein [Coriobacteriia bacterium]|nr:ATP-binding cassette domain-containing protein [Coriobacteriia bacterium]
MIRFDGVSYTYAQGSVDRRAVDDVSLTVDEGELVALVGANGSGKSTLARLGNGILLPTEGSVKVDGIDTRERSRARELHTRVGIVFQSPDDQIVSTSVEDDVAFGPENLCLPREEIRARVDQALATVGLTGLEQREPHLLSGGQKQRLALAGALALGPRYLILDEPTSMIDPQGRDDVLSIVDDLRESGHGILLVTHDLAEAYRADRVVVMARGAVAFSGAPSELYESIDADAVGIEVPSLIRLVNELRDAGVPVGEGQTTVPGVIEALCR